MPNALNWFEIPVSDFNRAKKFYETVLGTTIEPMPMGPTTMGMLSSDENAVGGALVHGGDNAPSENGTMVYLNGGEDLSPMLARAQQAGCRIVVPKTDIGSGFGFYAQFIDSEGNKVGLHSMG